MKFLLMACEDAGIEGAQREWIAKNFENNSVDFDCETLVEDQTKEHEGRRILRCIMGNDFADPEVRLRVRPSTRHQYARIAGSIDADEKIAIGLYNNGELKPDTWFVLSKASAAMSLEDTTPEKTTYFGEIQGIVHAFYKETDRPRLVVRELVSSALIDCFFRTDMYKNAVDVLMDPEAVVFVEGEVTENTAKGQIESVKVSDFRPAPEFDLTHYRAFLGSRPDLTGDTSTEEYIRKFRDHE